MKALIPATIFGTGMRPFTFTRPKPVLTVAGKPIIVHAIDALVGAGITQIGIVVSEVTYQAVRPATEGLPGVELTFLHQTEMLGLGNAVLTGREWVGDDDVCVYLGDKLFEGGVRGLTDTFRREGVDAVVGLIGGRTPGEAGDSPEGDGLLPLTGEIELPPDSVLAGLYCFSPRIFEQLALTASASTAPASRGEHEIMAAVAGLSTAGGRALGQRARGWSKDTGQARELIEANHLLLKDLESDVQGSVLDSERSGPVVLAAGSSLRNCKVVGPVLIAEGVSIEDSYIGPFTSIGADTVIRSAEVEHSIIEQGCVIENVETRLQDCLIGVRAVVRGGRRVPNTLKLTLSDASLLELT
ncbi:MAG: sugar phosphate nucleotidyltransferase [Deinococcus sp.]